LLTERLFFCSLWVSKPKKKKPDESFGDISMFNSKTVKATVIAIVFVIITPAFCATVSDNWNEYLHYTKIGRLDLAASYAQAILAGEPNAAELFNLSQANPDGYAILLKVSDSQPDTPLAQETKKILAIIDKGKFQRRTDARIIVEDIKRLSGTQRGQLSAVKSLQNAGEYAIPHILDAMSDISRKEELPNLIWALPQVGKDAIRPLAAALQTDNIAVKAEVIKALGKIGYPQSLPYLKYVVEKDSSSELKSLAEQSIRQIDPAAGKLSAAQLFYQLADKYYSHNDSLAPAQDAEFGNVWFWDAGSRALKFEKVDRNYFYELMTMRCCEWSLKSDPGFGSAIGLWIAAYFQAESTGIAVPNYFGQGHADAFVYATTAGPEYLHQALERAIKDKNKYVALAVVEALAATAGEKSLMSRVGPAQPLAQALSFDSRAVRYSAAIAIAEAGPTSKFPETKLVIENLSLALAETPEKADSNDPMWNGDMADSYALRAAKAMLKLAQTRNSVIALASAQTTLIDATRDKRTQIKTLAGQILAYLNLADAQKAITAMAMNENNPMDVRVSAFESLAVSAKMNANLLDDRMIDSLYSLVSSKDIDPKLRSAAAGAFGALNLPSKKVKDLILDQAKS
jgi:hypothetical protein